jgi:hypothetical protein
MSTLAPSAATSPANNPIAEQRRRARLERNRRLAQAEPQVSEAEARRFERLQARRDDPAQPKAARERAADELIALQRRLDLKRDQHWRDGALAETIDLAAATGAVVTRRADGGALRELGPGLGVLWTANRLTEAQMRAGKRYAHDFEDAEGSIRSSLQDGISASGGKGAGGGLPPPLQAGVFELARARAKGLMGDPALIAICNDVCGRGLKLTDLARRHADARADRTHLAALEERLKCALNLLCRHYGIRGGG